LEPWDIKPSPDAARFARHRALFANRHDVAEQCRESRLEFLRQQLDRAVAANTHRMAGTVPDVVLLELVERGDGS